jgi:hypothetical protein
MLPKEKGLGLTSAASSKQIATWSTVLLAGISLAYFSTMVVGVINSYSGLPYWDSWDGYLDDLIKIDNGNLWGWWAQHNEHRILLARLTFWLDLHVFGGNEIFLLIIIIVSVVVSMAVVVVALVHLLQQTYGSEKPISSIALFATLVVAFSSSWMQSENLIWGFQTQFVLVTTLPLATFVLIGLSAWLKTRGSVRLSGWALALAGLAASGGVLSMSGGLAAPWIALVGLVALRFQLKSIIAWGLGTLLLTGAYLAGYGTPPGQVSALHTIKAHPFDVAVFFLRYLGAPAFHVSGSAWLATLSGFVIVALAVLLGIRNWLNRASVPSAFTLSLFTAYILAVGLLTAAGRVPFGMEGAFSSRYSTPALALWLVTAALIWARLRDVYLAHPLRLTGLVAVILMVPASVQAGAISDRTQFVADRNLAGIALSLNIGDPEAIHTLYPDVNRALDLTHQARALGLTPLARSEFLAMGKDLGKFAVPQHEVPCRTSIFLRSGSASADFSRVAGFASITGLNHRAALGEVVDANNRIVGYISIGTSNVFGAAPTSPPPADSEMFSGYVLASATGNLRLSGASWTCSQAVQ